MINKRKLRAPEIKKNSLEALERIIDLPYVKNKYTLSKLLGISASHVSKWYKSLYGVPASHIHELEIISKRMVKAKEIRPDLFKRL